MSGVSGWWRARRAQFDWSLELLVLLLIGAEAAVATLVLTALFAELNQSWIAPGWIFIILFLGTNLQRAIDSYRFFSPQYELLSLGAVIVMTLLAVRLFGFSERPITDLQWPRDAFHALAFLADPHFLSTWAAVLFVAYAWWRGRTRDTPSLDAAYRALRFGTPVVVVAILGVMAAVPTENNPGLRQVLYSSTAVFLVFSLAAVALSRLRIEQERGVLTLTPRWLLTFLGPVVALMLVGAAIAGLFTRRFLETLLWLLSPLFWVVNLLLLILVYIMTGVAYVIFAIVGFLISLAGPPDPAPRPTQGITGTPAIDPTAGIRQLEYPDGLRYFVALLLVAALFFFLTRFFWRRRPRRLTVASEERESVFSWDLLAEGAAGFLAGLTARFRRPSDPLAELRRDPRWQYTVAIREAYQRLLDRGSSAHYPRTAEQTPHEYRRVVTRTAPSDPVTRLTDRYAAARYSDEPATATDAALAQTAWDEIAQVPIQRRPDSAE